MKLEHADYAEIKNKHFQIEKFKDSDLHEEDDKDCIKSAKVAHGAYRLTLEKEDLEHLWKWCMRAADSNDEWWHNFYDLLPRGEDLELEGLCEALIKMAYIEGVKDSFKHKDYLLKDAEEELKTYW